MLARRFPIDRRTRALLAVGALVPTLFGAAVIGIMTSRALPTGAALGDPDVLSRNLWIAAAYAAIVLPLSIGWGLWWTTMRIDADGAAARQVVLLALPMRLTAINAAAWAGATVLLVVVNIGMPWLATTLSVTLLLGATVTVTVTFWMCTRILRPQVAELLTANPPTVARRPGLRFRAVSSWVVGTGVPLLMLLLVGTSALVVEYPGNRLAVVVLALGGSAVVSGLFIAAFTGATTADPIDEVRRGMARVAEGDYDVTVPVFDATQLGLLQAGFNTMVAGLRERERLRDLFGRHVGRDVARLAEEAATKEAARDDCAPTAMGGANCEAAVLFVDLVGSSRLAERLSPTELVATLNDFFAIVVEVVEEQQGWVNKFAGDAALAIFGAPVAVDDAAGHALVAARLLNKRLNTPDAVARAGIGVSAGTVVAGNIGDPRRYEFTVIGDPVNEAARLSDVAKKMDGVTASGAALERASSAEALRWRIAETRVLRGRDATSDIAVPL